MGSSAGTINFGGQMAGVITPIVMGYLIDLQGGSFTGAFMFPVLGAVAAVVVAAAISNKSATMSVSRKRKNRPGCRQGEAGPAEREFMPHRSAGPASNMLYFHRHAIKQEV